MAPPWWSERDGAITVSVRVQPGARRSEVQDASGEQLRIRLAAPPVDGKANAELQRFLADLFGVRRSAVTLLRGERSRDKVARIEGVTSVPDHLN